MAALDISAMMWHIICSHIEGGQMPLSGEEDLDRKLLEIYDDQRILSLEQFSWKFSTRSTVPEKEFRIAFVPKNLGVLITLRK